MRLKFSGALRDVEIQVYSGKTIDSKFFTRREVEKSFFFSLKIWFSIFLERIFNISR